MNLKEQFQTNFLKHLTKAPANTNSTPVIKTSTAAESEGAILPAQLNDLKSLKEQNQSLITRINQIKEENQQLSALNKPDDNETAGEAHLPGDMPAQNSEIQNLIQSLGDDNLDPVSMKHLIDVINQENEQYRRIIGEQKVSIGRLYKEIEAKGNVQEALKTVKEKQVRLNEERQKTNNENQKLKRQNQLLLDEVKRLRLKIKQGVEAQIINELEERAASENLNKSQEIKNTIIDDLNYMIIEDNEQTTKSTRNKTFKKTHKREFQQQIRHGLQDDAYLDDEINQKIMAQLNQETPNGPKEPPETAQLEKYRIKSRKSKNNSINSARRIENVASLPQLPSLNRSVERNINVSRNRFVNNYNFTPSMRSNNNTQFKNSVEKELMYPYKANYNTAEKAFQPVALGNGIFSGLSLNGNSPKHTFGLTPSSSKMFNRGIPQKYSIRANAAKGKLTGKQFAEGLNEKKVYKNSKVQNLRAHHTLGSFEK